MDDVDMEIHIAKKLRPGDVIFWNDPCKKNSRFYTIEEITFKGQLITIKDRRTGEKLLCYAEQLS